MPQCRRRLFSKMPMQSRAFYVREKPRRERTYLLGKARYPALVEAKRRRMKRKCPQKSKPCNKTFTDGADLWWPSTTRAANSLSSSCPRADTGQKTRVQRGACPAPVDRASMTSSLNSGEENFGFELIRRRGYSTSRLLRFPREGPSAGLDSEGM